MKFIEYFVYLFSIFFYTFGDKFSYDLGHMGNNENPWINSFKAVPLNFKKEDDTEALKMNIYNRQTHSNQKQSSVRWPLGVVNYFVDVSSFDFLIIQRIRATMNIIEASSCVQFVSSLVKPTAGNNSWLHITNPEKQRDCVHEPLYKEYGEVVMVLGYDCLRNIDILHALLHGIGFMDEVTHPQRDKYVKVLWNNIHPAYRHLFTIREGFHSDLEYDPLSVMHFNDRDFTMNGRATIEPAVSGLLISPSNSLSQLDKLRLRLLFGHECNNREVVNLMKTCQNTLFKYNKNKDDNVTKVYNQELSDDVPTDLDTNERLNLQASEKDKIDVGTEVPESAHEDDNSDLEEDEELVNGEDNQNNGKPVEQKSETEENNQTEEAQNEDTPEVGRNRLSKLSVKDEILRLMTHKTDRENYQYKRKQNVKKIVGKRLMESNKIKNSIEKGGK